MYTFFFFLMIRRPPRSTLDRSSAASDVYKRQKVFKEKYPDIEFVNAAVAGGAGTNARAVLATRLPVSYTHLRAHETVLDLVCRLLLETKKKTRSHDFLIHKKNNKQ